MRVKFEQIRMVRTTQKIELFYKQMTNHFWQSVDVIFEDVSVAEQLFDAKLLVWILPSFSIPKNYGSPTCVTRLKITPKYFAETISLQRKQILALMLMYVVYL